MTDTATLEAILDDARTDLANRFHLYRVAADAARDMGEDGLAFGLDWLAENRREPMFCGMEHGWGWFANHSASVREYAHCLAFDAGRLAGRAPGYSKSWALYSTFADSVIAVARAVAMERFGKVD